MATKKRSRPADGFLPYWIICEDGIEYLKIQLGSWHTREPVNAVSSLRVPTHTIGLDPDSGAPIENRPSKSRRKSYE